MNIFSTKQRDHDFLEACKTKDCHTVRQFILTGCDPILIRNEYGQNALHVASLHGNMDVVELLVKVYDCNPAITDHEGRTALHLACMGGSIVVTDYLRKIVDYRLKDSSENTILHYACHSGDVPTVRYVTLLLTNQKYLCKLNEYLDMTTLYVNIIDSSVIALENKNGETALHTACRAGHLPVVRIFVEEVKLDQSQSEVLVSASKLACRYDRYDIFTYLVGFGCFFVKSVSPTETLNGTPSSPLTSAHPIQYWDAGTPKPIPLPRFNTISFRTNFLKPSLKFACQNGDERMVRHLIKDYKCDPLVPDSDTGDTLLHSAATSGSVSLINFLIDCQCDPMKTNIEGNTPLHEACKWGYIEIVEKLIHANPSAINTHNKMKESPLHLACSRNRSNIGKLLVSIDICDVMALNYLNETPLHVASCSSNYELIKCILNRSKDALKCTDNYEDTPLFNACRVGNVDVVKLFVEAGCDPLHVNSCTQELPIHIACRAGNVELFQSLRSCMKSESWNQANRFGQTPLHLVCEQGNLPLVNEILECASCDLYLKDKKGMTPLHVACMNNNTEIAKVILAQPTIDANMGDENRNTPLHLACINDNIDTVTLLMENEPDVTRRNEDGETPVHIACRHGRLQIFSRVLSTRKHGLKFSFNNEGVTPLHIASSGGHFEMVKDLVNGNYCDPNATSKQEGCTPLHFACYEGHMDITTYLVERAPQTVGIYDEKGRSPLLLALQMKHYGIVKFLVPQYFDPNSGIVSKVDAPLFICACDYGDTDLLKYLVSEANCKPTTVSAVGNTPVHFIVRRSNPQKTIETKFQYVLDVCSSQIDCSNISGDTPLLFACKLAKNNVVTALLEHGANPNCKDSRGDSPLHIACRSQNCDMVTALVHFKADVSCKDAKGDTPLHIACTHRYREHEIVEVSLDFKANTSSKDLNGKTPLHIACSGRSLDIVQLLLDYNADTSAQDSNRDTPLHIASRCCWTPYVNLLLDHEANTTCKNSDGKTPIQVTQSYDVIMMLIDHGANPQDVYTHYGEVLEMCRQEQPLHDRVKILIVGNALTGKTTLVEALKKEDIPVSLVDHVTERTAGIVSTQFKSDKLGYVTFHDFAGQQEFYSSHSQFLVNNLSSDAIVLLLVNGLDEDSELAKNVSYWMSFIKHHCSNTECLLHIVVICSHLDKLKDAKTLKEVKVKEAIQKYKYTGPVFLDCRDPASDGMCQLKNLLGDMCDKVRSNIELNCQCHVLFAFMHSRFEDTVELCEVQRAIRKTRDSYSLTQDSEYDLDLFPPLWVSSGAFKKNSRNPGDLLPQATHALLSLLKILDQIGHVILLKDENQGDKYWIILKQNDFHKTVHGTLFAPNNFVDNGPIPNTGVVPLPVLKEIFFEHTTNLKLITNYLVYKEFCHKIDDPNTLQLIQSEANTLLESDAELYFFPCFVKVEKQSTVWKQKGEQLYTCGWCLECRDEYFTNNFLHVLLLRLTFKYAASHKHDSSSSHLSRKCNIWKNGIHWFTTEGVEVLVELTHNHTFLLVLIRSLDETVTLECVKLRASVIRTVFDVLEKTCPGLKPSERLIHHGLQNYPHCDLISAEKISIKAVAETIKKGHPFSHSNNNEPIKLEKLLFFEPYCGIGKHLSLLYESNEEEMPSNYVLDLSECFSTRKDKLAYMLNVSPVDMGDIKAHPVCQENPALIPHRIIEHWKISTRRGSYSDLREAFDKYSIFNGRNPLALCN